MLFLRMTGDTGTHQLAKLGQGWIEDGAERLHPHASDQDETKSAQHREVFGDRCLRYPQLAGEGADIALPALQADQDADASGIGQPAKAVSDTFHHFVAKLFHIYIL